MPSAFIWICLLLCVFYNLDISLFVLRLQEEKVYSLSEEPGFLGPRTIIGSDYHAIVAKYIQTKIAIEVKK